MNKNSGSVEAIFTAAKKGAALAGAPAVEAVAGRGLQGDRYFDREGTFSANVGPGRQVTLIEAEALDALARDYGCALEPGASRRNIVTRGVALNHLVGHEFRVGAATLRGVKLCEPCGHLAKLTVPAVKTGLVHRGGLRAEVVAGGTIRVGDAVEVTS